MTIQAQITSYFFLIIFLNIIKILNSSSIIGSITLRFDSGGKKKIFQNENFDLIEGKEFNLYLKENSITKQIFLNDSKFSFENELISIDKRRILAESINVNYVSYNFSSVNSEITLEFLRNLNTTKSLFFNSEANWIKFDNFTVSGIKDMSYMFYGCNELTYLNLGSFNTSDVTNMEYMFYNCEKLTNLDISSFNTKNVKYMNDMFHDCKSLTTLNLLSFNTENTQFMSNMFSNCSKLISLDLSSMESTNIKYMSDMFNGCSSLTSINLFNFKLSDKSFFTYLPSLKYCIFSEFNSFIEQNINTSCNNFLGFHLCGSCINNDNEFCLKNITINSSFKLMNFYYLNNESDSSNTNYINDKTKRQCYFENNFSIIDNKNIKCEITSNNNISLCKSCNEFYYKKIKDKNLLEFECFNENEINGYTLFEENDIKYFYECNDDCIKCILREKNNKQICKECWIYGNCTKSEKNSTELNELNGYIFSNKTDKEFYELYLSLKSEILKNNLNNQLILETENRTLQIYQSNNQNTQNNKISYIDLSECVKLLKNNNNIPLSQPLTIITIDIKNKSVSSTYVSYEILNPLTGEELNLSQCENLSVTMYVPVYINDKTSLLYNSLKELGYNLFDSNDSFYTDICSPFSTENGTDILLDDRKNKIYNENISLCQNDCKLISYNDTNKKAKCVCDIKENDIYNPDFDKNILADNFYDILKNTNFKVLQCYKLVFSWKGEKNNIGSIILIIFGIFFIGSLIFYFYKDNKKEKEFLQQIINDKKAFKRITVKRYKTTINNNKCVVNKDDKKIEIKEKENIIIVNKTIVKKKKKKKKSNNPSKSTLIYVNVINGSSSKNDSKRTLKINTNLTRSKKKCNQNNSSLFKQKNILFDNNINKNQILIFHTPTNKKSSKINYDDVNNINDEEINSLSYKQALFYDKRNIIEYYWSLLKKKHLIFFTFIPQKDFNLFSLKFSLLILSFAFYFMVNAFFFTDNTMHNVTREKSNFDIIYNIPQILYSTIICALINAILKFLALSEKILLGIKKEENFKIALRKSIILEKRLKIKFSIFFLLSSIIFIFCWYYIACFCAVYINTQKLLIKDTFVSFGLSMLYPFGLNLLPALLRKWALNSENKNKECLYKFSKVVALI